MTPPISILVTVYNRRELTRRCIDSILKQSFKDFELIIIDDASTEPPDLPLDERIKYYRNEVNQGKEHGDRIHFKRFVNELSCGKYFSYMCNDDRWVNPKLLETQIECFKEHPDTAMVTGGQMNYFMRPEEFVRNTGGHEPVFYEHAMPAGHMSSDEFLEYFSMHPTTANINRGAALFNREIFIKSGALQGDGGKWEGGYEITIAPCCYGGHIYLDVPCIETTIHPDNASFQGTQLLHYLDSVDSIKAGFRQALIDFPERNLERIQKQIIHNIGQAYLANARHIAMHGSLSMCSAENISRPVTEADLVHV